MQRKSYPPATLPMKEGCAGGQSQKFVVNYATHLRYIATMRSDTLNIRINASTKQALRAIADKEKRSMSKMIDWFVERYCQENGLNIPRPKSEEEASASTRKSSK